VQDRRPPQGVFVGRAAEVAHVTDVIARVATGQPWLVAIEGDPGVGKTALARCCLAGAEDVSLRVLLARADQAEADLDFGLVDQLLRRMGQRRLAIELLQRANAEYQALRAAPFLARVEAELVACRLPGSPAKKQSVLALTSRETQVAHLVGKGLSNPEIASELFISRKAVEYHLGNIYAKCGLQGRQQLRRFVEQWAQPAAV
jgi:DNA-binding CsgD family transcriptional regulator